MLPSTRNVASYPETEYPKKEGSINFYDKPKLRNESSKRKEDGMDARLMNSKEYGHLNSDLNSFRSNENDSYHNQNQQLSDNAAGP